MAELTPELEAVYALHWNVPRRELSAAAQLEYDRRRPAWERGEARPGAGELDAARLAWEQEYPPRQDFPLKHDSGPARHAVGRSGTTRTFRYKRGLHLFLGIVTVIVGVGVLVAVAATLAYPSSSFARGDGGVSTWDDIWMAAAGLLLVWLGIRMLRVGVLRISAGMMTVRGYFRTRTVAGSEIGGITLQPKDNGEGRLRWVGRVELTGRKGFWISGFDCGRANKPPKPKMTAILDEVRALLGVRADEIGRPETRQDA